MTKYKGKETKIGLSLVYCGAAYTNETSRVYDLFMNFFVFPREIREINKRGVGSQKITKK